jgi:hypothetical protein
MDILARAQDCNLEAGVLGPSMFGDSIEWNIFTWVPSTLTAGKDKFTACVYIFTEIMQG